MRQSPSLRRRIAAGSARRPAWGAIAVLAAAALVLYSPRAYLLGHPRLENVALMPPSYAGPLYRVGARKAAAASQPWRRPFVGERPEGLDDAVAAEQHPVCAVAWHLFGNCRFVGGVLERASGSYSLQAASPPYCYSLPLPLVPANQCSAPFPPPWPLQHAGAHSAVVPSHSGPLHPNHHVCGPQAHAGLAELSRIR